MNRLSTVADASGTTTYTYDNVGNLQSFAYPNGVTTSYAYDTLHRLNQVVAAVQGAPVASYAYTLGAAGNRTSVAELSGRSVGYGYDALYRLTQESVSADPNGKNGTVSYAYDNVGNRQQMNSTLGAVPAGVFFYNPNDQLTTDTYDANGNTTASAGIASTYDFENHMVSKGAVTIVYDGDGNRVAETVGGVTTKYLVDTQNPTGYAQVVDEIQNSAVTKTYSYGLERISENWQPTTGNWQRAFYGYDGHGSVRFLTNSAGAVTDTYDYDAFGNLTNSTGSTPNNYLFAGEQLDPALNLYYNRARYLNTSTGRFWSMDSYEGDSQSPMSLHKYLYTADNPVTRLDRSGHDFDLGSTIGTLSVQATLYVLSVPILVGEAFQEGGPAVGQLFNELGTVAETYGAEVLEEAQAELPELEVLPQQTLSNNRVIDFVVRNAQTAKELLVEAKYGIPYRAGPAMDRLVAQVEGALADVQSGGQVVLWTLKTPTAAQLQLLESELGTTFNNVQLVSGVEDLYTIVVNYFKAP